MKKRNILLIAGGAVALMTALTFIHLQPNTFEAIVTNVEHGTSEMVINTSGELEAKTSTPVLGPRDLSAAGLWMVKIEDILEEGTHVKKGDFVATLDRTELSARIRNEELEVEKSLNNLKRTQIDTALTLRGLRDELKKKSIAVEKSELELRNSPYGPPAAFQQAKLNVKEAKMDYHRALEEYELWRDKSVSDMKRRQIDLKKDQENLALLNRLIDQFIIRAPEDGMLIYRNERGHKINKGSAINAHDPVVATLIDLGKMVSLCHVNEVDIWSVKVGQAVRVGVDALPEKKLSGKVAHVANIGEMLASLDARVFEVEVEINESDPRLKPGMTTTNEILVNQVPDSDSVPLKGVHLQDDSINFVYMRKGPLTIKKQITVGINNSNFIIVKEGLQEDRKVMLTVRENADALDLVRLN